MWRLEHCGVTMGHRNLGCSRHAMQQASGWGGMAWEGRHGEGWAGRNAFDQHAAQLACACSTPLALGFWASPSLLLPWSPGLSPCVYVFAIVPPCMHEVAREACEAVGTRSNSLGAHSFFTPLAPRIVALSGQPPGFNLPCMLTALLTRTMTYLCTIESHCSLHLHPSSLQSQPTFCATHRPGLGTLLALLPDPLKACLTPSPSRFPNHPHRYSDPITQFLEDLFVHYDFDGAQHKLVECEAVIDNDFFLTAFKEDFVESARLFIFEIYCR